MLGDGMCWWCGGFYVSYGVEAGREEEEEGEEEEERRRCGSSDLCWWLLLLSYEPFLDGDGLGDVHDDEMSGPRCVELNRCGSKATWEGYLLPKSVE
jgi:hypothetical protein